MTITYFDQAKADAFSGAMLGVVGVQNSIRAMHGADPRPSGVGRIPGDGWEKIWNFFGQTLQTT